MSNIDEIRAKADELLNQNKYSCALPLYEQAAEMGDLYSAARAATLNVINAKFYIEGFQDFSEAERYSEQALQWYNTFKDVNSFTLAMFFDDSGFLRELGYCYYRLALEHRGEEKEGDLLYQCFSLLSEVVDSSEEHPDTQGLWALTVQRMLDLDWDISTEAINRKNELFSELISTKKEALCACENYDPILSKIYIDYGFVLLDGAEIAADHTKAYYCFKSALEMGMQSVERILSKFAETAPGKYTFVG